MIKAIISKVNNICVIGLGFVGLPMSIVIATSKKIKKQKVYGLEKNNKHGNTIVNNLKNNQFIINTEDAVLKKKYAECVINKNFFPTTDLGILKKCKTVLISINFEGKKNNFSNIISLTKKIFEKISPNTLIIFETTFVPGTIEKVVLPEAKKAISKRNLNINDFYIGYSYERVMPGDKYYDSIVNNLRVFSAINKKSKIKVKKFFSSIINTNKFPLTELDTITECEAAKILENSFRAINIAFIDEWTKYSLNMNLNLFNIIDSIKKRKTHNNLMYPGLGVGGYCLTKDPLFVKKSNKIFSKNNIKFPITDIATKINNNMPKTSFDFIKRNLNLKKIKKILILGLAYKGEVSDKRYSQSITIIDMIKKFNNKISFSIHDFYITEKEVINKIPNVSSYDLIIACTGHKKYRNSSFKGLNRKKYFFDLNNVLSGNQINLLRKKTKLFCLGRNN